MSGPSRDQRHLLDLPWGPRPVRSRVTLRKVIGRHPRGRRRLFTERVPELVAAYARTTPRLVPVRPAIGVARGRQAGTRLPSRVGVPASRDPLWRLVRRLPLPAWGHEPPSVTAIARARLKAYLGGARAGAPPAIQVAARVHLLQNRAEALEPVFSTPGTALKAVRDMLSRTPGVQPEGPAAVPVPPRTPTPPAPPRAAQRRARRRATDDRGWTLHRQGWSTRAMAPQLGIGRMTGVRALQAPTFPERKGHTTTGRSALTPDKARLLTRRNAGGREA